jgi:D-xylose transport system substrate-binding protein
MRGALSVLVVGVCALGAGCGSSDSSSGSSASGSGGDTTTASASSGGGGGGKKIAFLLPQTGVPRFEHFDRPYFEQAVHKQCADCEVLYANAQNEDAAKQQQQAEAALSNGASVLVMQAVDGKAAKVIADEAAAKGVPVIAYEREIQDSTNVKAHVTFDPFKVGQLQGETLLKGMAALGKPKGPYLMINGSPTDSGAAIYRDGAKDVLDKAGAKMLASFDTPGWDPAKAQAQMDQWITKYGKDAFVGVYAANGGTGGGAIAAMKSAGVDPATHPTTGQDADLVEIQRIIANEQYMTVYKPIRKLADAAAQIAIALAEKKQPDSSMFNSTTDMGTATKIPADIIDPVAVTKDNVKDTVVADGFYSIAEICTGQYKADCAKAGLS